MIGHEQCKMGVPDFARVSMFHRFEDPIRYNRMCKLIFPAPFASNGNEIICFGRINPKGNVVRQSFANSYFHG